MKAEKKILIGIYALFIAIAVALLASCSPDPYAHCTKYQIGYGSNTPAKYYKNQR